MANVKYTREFYREFTGARDWLNDDIRAGLIIGTASSPFDPSHEFVSDIVQDEADDASYARVQLSGIQVTVNDANVRVEISADPISFPGLDGDEVIGCFLYCHKGSDDSANELIGIFDHEDITPIGNGITLNIGATGFMHGRQV